MESLKFIADNNVGKLARWLRMVGFDTKLFNGEDDADMVAIALAENRIILTRDTSIMERRIIVSGEVNPYQQRPIGRTNPTGNRDTQNR